MVEAEKEAAKIVQQAQQCASQPIPFGTTRPLALLSPVPSSTCPTHPPFSGAHPSPRLHVPPSPIPLTRTVASFLSPTCASSSLLVSRLPCSHPHNLFTPTKSLVSLAVTRRPSADLPPLARLPTFIIFAHSLFVPFVSLPHSTRPPVPLAPAVPPPPTSHLFPQSSHPPLVPSNPAVPFIRLYPLSHPCTSGLPPPHLTPWLPVPPVTSPVPLVDTSNARFRLSI